MSCAYRSVLRRYAYCCTSSCSGLRGAGGCCGLHEPGFETCLTESCVIARNQCFLADFRSRVTRAWISDDFAGIFERGQAPPHEIIHAKLGRVAAHA